MILKSLTGVRQPVQKPHPAEPEYVSQGRFKKMMADRRNGNLDDKKLESVLKEMRNCIPQQDKVSFVNSLRLVSLPISVLKEIFLKTI